MKEVKLKWVAGPFTHIPFKNFVQSPIGLVPKAGDKTRLIFHLSYEFKNGNHSINFWTPKKECTVHYNDIQHTVNNCLNLLQNLENHTEWLFFGKTDLQSAFRILPGLKKHWFLLVFKAENLESGMVMYFVDKAMPFGASISCRNFQRFSNTLKHIVKRLNNIQSSITNYLDDFCSSITLEGYATNCCRHS